MAKRTHDGTKGRSDARVPLANQPRAQELAGKVALVTGASAGIGAEFARFLAERGAAVALVARRRERLEEIAADLKQHYAARTHVIIADLAECSAAEHVVHECTAALGSPDILINCAGYGPTAPFADAPWEENARFLHLMTASYAELAHRTVQNMRKRNWGRIVNVSSVASFTPQQRGSLYGPAKQFVTGFSQALALEMNGTGVNVCASCPGFTYTEFHDVMGNRSHMQKLPKWLWSTAERVVRESWNAVERGQSVAVIGGVNKFIVALCRTLPESAVHIVSPKALRERGDHKKKKRAARA